MEDQVKFHQTYSAVESSVAIGKPINVNLSYVYSTKSFFVHLNYDDVENFYMNFNEYYSKLVAENDTDLKPSSISIKQLCCVKNDDDSSDYSYYRAQILKETDGEYLVRFVDFGDMKMVQPKSIFKLFPEYEEKSIFALHCYLEGAWTTDCAKLETAFRDFLTMPNSYCTEIKAKFQPSQSSNKIPVSLEVKLSDGSWKDLKDCNFDRVQVAECVSKHIFNFPDFCNENLLAYSFSNNSQNTYEKLASLSENSLPVCNGICPSASFDSIRMEISNFIFSQSLATEFTTNLSFFYRGFVEHISTSVEVNSMVVFRIENFFFRGFVLNDDSKKYGTVHLFSVDFGFVFSVKKDKIFPLFEDFSLANFPCFSALCALDNVIPIEYDMTHNLYEKVFTTFQAFVQGTFTIYPKSFSNGSHSVEVEMADKRRIHTLLKEMNLVDEFQTVTRYD